MEEIRCPMCSKLNPAENEECQYCNARLKPLVASAEGAGEQAGPQEGEDAPEWINRLAEFEDHSGDEPAKTAADQPAPAADTGPAEPGSWLARLQKDVEKYEESKADLPAVEPEFPASPAAGDSLPEWLRNVRQAANRDLVEPPLGVPVIEPGSSEEDAWLEKLRNQKFEPPEKPILDVNPDAGLVEPPAEPDWLHAFPDRKEESVEGEPAASAASGLPEWLSGGAPSTEPEAISDWNTGSQPVQPAEIPDWLGDETPSHPAEEQPVEEKPALPPGISTEPEVDKPDWLIELEAHAPQAPAPFPASPMLNFDQPPAGEVAARVENNFPAEELPDWLASFGPAASQAPAVDGTSAQAGDEHTGGEAAPADLPSWLRAMRPIETVAPSPAARRESDQREEKTGPLAGLRGTLPAEPSLASFQRPPSYIARLQPTENQERYKSIFEELIANEKEPQPTRAAGLISPQRLWRLIIAVLLLAAVVVPFVTGISFLPLPGLLPQETLDMQTAIDALPANAMVLVGVEYEPSLAGEMESAAAGVVDHLMKKGARLAVISTSPTGPALADRLFDQVTALPEDYHASYTGGEKLANLGYLAGGPAGLMDFVLRPQAAAPAMLDDGTSAWQQPALRGVNSLDDFSLFLLITDDQQSGRTWLEQIQPRTAANAPLLVVSSAQAAPVLSSYLDGRQVDGLTAGLAGGTIYEQLLQHPGPGTGRWQAFVLVMAVSLVVIILGTAVDLIMEYLAARKANAEA